MAIVHGPLMSLFATGSIGKKLIFQRAKNGKTFCKKWSEPRNPDTDTQKSIRVMIRFLNAMWSSMGSSQLSWNTLALGTDVTGYNVFIQRNMKEWCQNLAPSTATLRGALTLVATAMDFSENPYAGGTIVELRPPPSGLFSGYMIARSTAAGQDHVRQKVIAIGFCRPSTNLLINVPNPAGIPGTLRGAYWHETGKIGTYTLAAPQG